MRMLFPEDFLTKARFAATKPIRDCLLSIYDKLPYHAGFIFARMMDPLFVAGLSAENHMGIIERLFVDYGFADLLEELNSLFLDSERYEFLVIDSSLFPGTKAIWVKMEGSWKFGVTMGPE